MKKTKLMTLTVLLLSCIAFISSRCGSENPLGSDDDIIPDELDCGPCGTIESGDATISGDAALDGFFSAVASLNIAASQIHADFDAHVRALAVAFEVEGAADAKLKDLVGEVVAEIKAEFDASIKGGIKGGLKVAYVPPKCEINVQASFEAQAKCEAKAGCDVEVECEPGKLSFECKGECHGGCKGDCELPMCTIEMEAELKCEGECSGQCVTDVSGKCEGTCRGECDGKCAAYVENADGEFECNGACEGECKGECGLEVQAECGGKCEGQCKVEAKSDVDCKGELECHGECKGECSGGCEGEIKKPKCEGSAECDASAKCEAQAEANASANVKCNPPSLDLQYVLKADIETDAKAKARFMGQLQAFKVHMIGILQGQANIRILFDGKAAGEIGLEDAPIVTLKKSLEGLADAGIEGEFKVSLMLIDCTLDALKDAAKVMGSIGGKMETTFEGQAEFAGILF